jgi:1,4-alpha-glucan branching enzyme
MSKERLRDIEPLSDLDLYLFGQGTNYEIYRKLGAHKMCLEGTEGIYFAVWAPKAVSVRVVGEFNDWNPERNYMACLGEIGVYEAFIPEAREGMLYKFCIESKRGDLLYKADPYANYAELRPGTASRIADIEGFLWKDKAWIEKRKQSKFWEAPISIYEVHPGSWKKHTDSGDEDGFYNYREFARSMVEYIKDMGYTHVELMGIAEHPFDGSWGYQVTGYYAPTSRYGTPKDFQYMVDLFHRNRIGVILDWVPAHFPRDAHGLAEFDGTCVYEYADPRKGEHPDWGTKIFDYEKNEVKNFLIANALFWVEHFHIDGLRVDAVASMLYLDYGKQDGQWIPNKYGSNENLEAIEFFKHLNTVVTRRNPGALMIAEESTAWPMVTGAPKEGGLGFQFKWNMGWMHDFLEYMKLDPFFRKDNHNKMTFAMTYAHSENYILVLSHDEVVHLKNSMLGKMPGTPEEKFANLKAGYAFMFGHPGKKLLFMGQEFGQLREWSEKREIDWFLLEDPNHRNLQNFLRRLLHLYKKYPAFYDQDAYGNGFQWINADDAYRSIYSFVRYGKSGRNNLLFVVNFTPVAYPDYRVGVPKKKKYVLLLNSEDAAYGGTEEARPAEYMAEAMECDGESYSIAYPLPAFGVAIFRF